MSSAPDDRDQVEAGYGTGAPKSCPYGHTGSVYAAYGRSWRCAKCGVKIVNYPGVEIN